MTKMLVVFLVLALAIGLGIRTWQGLHGKEKWQLTKIVGFSIISAALAVSLLIVLVIFF